MIKFFRKIRQKLLVENKFSKYLLYAIGEIVLVIIGILIALSVNNKNEMKKNERKFEYNLLQVHKELEINIQNTREGILFYQKQDSIIGSIMSDTLEVEDFKTSDGYYLTNVLFQWHESVVFNKSFNKLNEVTFDSNDSYKSIISSLDKLYLDKEKGLLKWDEIMFSLIMKHEFEFGDKHTWFSSYLWNNEISDEAINFFLENPFYKNHIADLSNNVKNYLKAIKSYRVGAIKSYNLISDLLDVPIEINLDSLGYKINKDILKCYVGKYKYGKGNSMEIILEDGKLMSFVVQGEESFKEELHAISSVKFFTIEDRVLFEFAGSDNCKSPTLIWKMYGTEYKFDRIEDSKD